MNMKALIIAAGKGSRLESLGKGEPKPLLRLLGLSLIERVILSARQARICEFVVIVGYLGNKIREKLGEGNKYGVKITYIENPEWQSGNGVSVLKAREQLNDKFLLLMSDHIFDGRILKALLTYDSESSVVLAIDRREALAGDTQVLEREGMIIAIGKDIGKANCIDTGIFLCSPKIFSYIDEAISEGRMELADGIALAAERGDAKVFDIGQIDSYVPSMRKEIKAFWVDIDSKEDITKAQRLLIENACKGRNDLLATYVNKPIENFIVDRLVNSRITPNWVTVLTNVVAYSATFLFFKGYLLPASLLTFIVSFMDGVDGKLARVKLAASNLGKMEHAFDFLFEHSWYIALALWLGDSYGIRPLLLCTFVILFDSFSHRCGGAFGKAIRNRPLADYGRIEQLFRKFDGRKNSYIIFILIGVLLNKPMWSLVAIGIWSFVSTVFYLVRTIQHIHAMDRSGYGEVK